MRPEPPIKPANAPSAGNTSSSTLPAGKNTGASFRDAIKRRESPRDRLQAKPTLPAGAHVRGDGMLVIDAMPLSAAGQLGERARRAATNAESLVRSERPGRSVALTDVKIGGTKDSVQVHARLGEGRHAGVELRAVERNGKVSIELVARDAMAERALRVELGEIRDALRVRGLDGVSVDVRSDDDAPRRHDPDEAGEIAHEADVTKAHTHEPVAPRSDEDTIVL